MKTFLSTALLSLFCVAAVGCVEGPDDNDLDLDTLELRPGFEVIVVDAVDSRPEIVDDGLELSPDVGDALVTDDDGAFEGGADTIGEAPADDDTFVGGADTIGEVDDGNAIVDADLDSQLPPGAVDADNDIEPPLVSPCDCTGADCLESWVEENLGCDVCAVFTCGQDDRPAACHACQ